MKFITSIPSIYTFWLNKESVAISAQAGGVSTGAKPVDTLVADPTAYHTESLADFAFQKQGFMNSACFLEKITTANTLFHNYVF
jgi:hypothetical protein